MDNTPLRLTDRSEKRVKKVNIQPLPTISPEHRAIMSKSARYYGNASIVGHRTLFMQVIGYHGGRSGAGKPYWFCLCDCGKLCLFDTHDMTIRQKAACCGTCPCYVEAKVLRKVEQKLIAQDSQGTALIVAQERALIRNTIKLPTEVKLTHVALAFPDRQTALRYELFYGQMFDRLIVLDFTWGQGTYSCFEEVLSIKCRCLCGNICDISRKTIKLKGRHSCSPNCLLNFYVPQTQKYLQNLLLPVVQYDGDCWIPLSTVAVNNLCKSIGEPLYTPEWFFYVAFKEYIPNQLAIVHDCGNDRCLNPAHLRKIPPPKFRLMW